MTTLDEKLKDAAQEHGKGGNADFFQFKKSGTYRLRILSDVEAMATHFFGKGVPGSVCYGESKGCPFHDEKASDPSVKFTAYVLDRTDNKIKLGELPWSVVSALSDYQKDEEYSFSEYPMPYDVKVTVDKENKDPKQIYKTIAGAARTPLTAEQQDELKTKLEKMPVAAYIQKRKDNQIIKHKEEGVWVTDEQRAEKEEERKTRAREIAEVDGAAAGGEYPNGSDEGINPDDIPF